MKRKVFRIVGLFTLLAVIFIAVTAFTNNNNGNTVPSDKNSCTVIVKYSNGSPAADIKVSGDVCGSISCIGNTGNVYTDNNGKATIEWSDGCKLCYIYVKGTSHKDDYKNGETYNFSL